MSVEYKPLEQNTLQALGIENPSFNGQSPSLASTSSLIVTIFFILIGGAAFYRYLMAGIYRIEASEAGITKSNTAFKEATLGLLGIFFMFLILMAFNKDILRSDVGLSSLKTKPGAGATTPIPGGVTPNQGQQSSSTQPLPSGACVRKTPCTQAHLEVISGAKDSATRQRLQEGGVSVNVGACTFIGQKSCTNVGGLPEDVVSMLKQLRSSCNCAVVVSGGTEWWSHSTHGPNVPVVDLRIPNTNDALYQFIAKQRDLGGTSACHIVREWNGWHFCDEKSGAYVQTTARHWHVKKL